MGKFVNKENLKHKISEYMVKHHKQFISSEEVCKIIEDFNEEGRIIDADKLHYKKVSFLGQNEEARSAVVVFAKEIDKLARSEATLKAESDYVSRYTNRTVCFFGARPNQLFGYKKEAYSELMDILERYAENLYQRGYRNFITGGSQGFEQLMFWAVNRIRSEHSDIQNVVFLPFPGIEVKWTDEGTFSKAEFNQILKAATEVIIENSKAPDDSDMRKWLMGERNRTMADASDLAVFMIPEKGETYINTHLDYCASTGCIIEKITYTREGDSLKFKNQRSNYWKKEINK